MGTDSSNITNRLPRIAIDAMGGDFAPQSIIDGTIEASINLPAQLFLVGDSSEINRYLKGRHYDEKRITIIDAKGRVGETDHPIMALKKNPDDTRQ